MRKEIDLSAFARTNDIVDMSCFMKNKDAGNFAAWMLRQIEGYCARSAPICDITTALVNAFIVTPVEKRHSFRAGIEMAYAQVTAPAPKKEEISAATDEAERLRILLLDQDKEKPAWKTDAKTVLLRVKSATEVGSPASRQTAPVASYQ